MLILVRLRAAAGERTIESDENNNYKLLKNKTNVPIIAFFIEVMNRCVYVDDYVLLENIIYKCANSLKFENG